MNPIIPDTLEGALILSLIDFFASFVIISGIGVVLALFPLLNRLGRIPATRRAAREVPPQAAAAEIAAEVEPGEHLAVIAAAVFATLADGHRIVRIEPARGGEGWAAEGRLAHHGSHVRQGGTRPTSGGSR